MNREDDSIKTVADYEEDLVKTAEWIMGLIPEEARDKIIFDIVLRIPSLRASVGAELAKHTLPERSYLKLGSQ